MKIVIDCTPLLLRSAGVKTALYHWVCAMREEAGGDEILLYPPIRRLGRLVHEGSVSGRWETWAGMAMAVANQRARVPFPEWFARGADVFHCTNQVRTPPRRIAVTATIHDLTCWKMPELHSGANVRADREFADRVLRQAAGLIAVSECTRRDAIEVLGIPPERIRTIHNGVAEAYFEAPDPPPRLRPYVLFLGTIEPRKNVDRLLDAWELLPAGIRRDYELLLAGGAGWRCEATIERLRRAPAGVRWLGYFPEAQLPELIRGAAMLVYPSLYEGFGLPVAQAMACGTPCVASNVSSLPEIAGDAALLVTPESVEEIRDAIVQLIESPELRRRLSSAGRARAEKMFRWQRAARESLRFFHEVSGK
ncbi:MAG: glycosyltransferase family 4 protein [Bryobacteraceae bacterium]|nr:glycosyltransferase family 4 protein [Bryobacteraceae bacterium]